MTSLKEQIANTGDLMEKDITVNIGEKPFHARIRRLTVEERDEIFKTARGNDSGDDVQKGSEASCLIFLKGLVGENYTLEEVKKLPAILVEAVAKSIMDFNGWTSEGQRFLDDQFRTKT